MEQDDDFKLPLQLFAICVDDSLPTVFTPDNWIKRGKMYKVAYLGTALNISEEAVGITDSKNQPIFPSDQYKTFKAERFTFITICLN
jgi:hypothetical protein